MKRKSLTVEERAAFRFHDNHGIHDCDNKHCDRFIERLTKAIRAAVRAALRKRDWNRAQETPIRLDVEALRKRRGTR